MHAGPMKDSEGDLKPGCAEKHTCRKCGEKAATCELWESSCGGYEDYRYTCAACKHVWWVEGIDS